MSKLRCTWLSLLAALLLSVLVCIVCIGVAVHADDTEIGFKEGGQSYDIGYNVDNNRAFRLELVNADDAKTAYGGFETLPSAVGGKTNGDLIILTGKDGTEKTVNEWKQTVGTKEETQINISAVFPFTVIFCILSPTRKRHRTTLRK